MDECVFYTNADVLKRDTPYYEIEVPTFAIDDILDLSLNKYHVKTKSQLYNKKMFDDILEACEIMETIDETGPFPGVQFVQLCVNNKTLIRVHKTGNHVFDRAASVDVQDYHDVLRKDLFIRNSMWISCLIVLGTVGTLGLNVM